MKSPKTKGGRVAKLKVPIFTEEFAINVFIGSRANIIRESSKYLSCSFKAVENDYGNCRGRAWNALDKIYGSKHPLIVIDGDYPIDTALATVAHEASHAMDFIEEYIGVNDKNGEFHAHGISAVMRAVNKVILPKKLKK